LEDARQLLDVPKAQEKVHFRDLITGDERWVYFDMKPKTVWLPADVDLPVRVKSTIESEKPVLVLFGEFTGSYTITDSRKRSR
jgi:hypothetical protein